MSMLKTVTASTSSDHTDIADLRRYQNALEWGADHEECVAKGINVSLHWVADIVWPENLGRPLVNPDASRPEPVSGEFTAVL